MAVIDFNRNVSLQLGNETLDFSVKNGDPLMHELIPKAECADLLAKAAQINDVWVYIGVASVIFAIYCIYILQKREEKLKGPPPCTSIKTGDNSDP